MRWPRLSRRLLNLGPRCRVQRARDVEPLMTFKLKIASPFDSTVGPDSSVAAIMQALAEALAKDVGPASVEDAANLPSW